MGKRKKYSPSSYKPVETRKFRACVYYKRASFFIVLTNVEFLLVTMDHLNEEYIEKTILVNKIKLFCVEHEININECYQEWNNSIYYYICQDKNILTDCHYTLIDGSQLITEMTGYKSIEELHPNIKPPYKIYFNQGITIITQNGGKIIHSNGRLDTYLGDTKIGEFTDKKSIELFFKLTKFNIRQTIIFEGAILPIPLLQSLGEDILNNYLFSFSKKYCIYSEVTGIWRDATALEVATELFSICRERILQNEKLAMYFGKFRSNDFIQAIQFLLNKGVSRELNRAKFPLLGHHVLNNRLVRNQRNDYLFTSCGWRYDVTESRQYADELMDFLKKLFPDVVERMFIISFCHSLLTGDRTEKKILILTDDRGGDNGKTTFINFLCGFFGDMAFNNTRLFLNTQIQDKNGQDSILYQLFNKRLIVGNEFKDDMKLDISLLKKLTGMDKITGRHFCQQETFSFTPQAGVILVYNSGDSPSFDLSDVAFDNRRIVLRLRSKFVSNIEDDWENFLFKKRIITYQNFYSAFLDLLLGSQKINWTEITTEAMMNAKEEAGTKAQRELVEFFKSEVKADDRGYLVIRDLWTKYKEGGGDQIKLNDFKTQAKIFFTKRGGIFKNRYSPRIDGSQVCIGNVILRFKAKGLVLRHGKKSRDGAN